MCVTVRAERLYMNIKLKTNNSLQKRFEQIKQFLHISDPCMNVFEPADSEEELYNKNILDSI